MNVVSLPRRFFGTLIDKVLISLIFITLSMSFCEGPPGAELGTFLGLLKRNYNNIESVKTLHERNVETDRFCKEHGYPTSEFIDSELEYNNTARNVYDRRVLIFVLINLIYYGFSEFLFRASPGKFILKCQVCRSDGRTIGNRDAFKRLGLLALFLFLSVVFQKSFNLSGITTSIIYFLFLDFSVFTIRQSLLDRFSNTFIVKT